MGILTPLAAAREGYKYQSTIRSKRDQVIANQNILDLTFYMWHVTLYNSESWRSSHSLKQPHNDLIKQISETKTVSKWFHYNICRTGFSSISAFNHFIPIWCKVWVCMAPACKNNEANCNLRWKSLAKNQQWIVPFFRCYPRYLNHVF